MERKRLGEMLLELGVIDESQLDSALNEHHQWGSPLGHTVVQMGYADEETVIRAVARQLNLPAVRVEPDTAEDEALRMLEGDFCRANNWGVDFQSYAESANDEIAVVVMIESRQGVENIDAILAVDGVDGVFIGPYDMSGSYGIPGQTDAPIVRNACRQVVRACERAQKAAGLHIVDPSPEAIRQAIGDGFTLICLGVDTVFVDQGARAALKLAHSALEGA